MADVALEGVSKIYAGGVWAVRDVALGVRHGELAVLVGPSGCGKTTLLRLVAGLETPSAGSIRIGGRLVNREPPHRRDVAMVFQRPALYPHLRVRENLGFGLRLRRPIFFKRLAGTILRRGPAEKTGGLDEAERVGEVARLLGLGDVLDRRPGDLSGGQQQRVALGRALVRRPAVFLLDEPLASLDARLRAEMRGELHLLHGRFRATMILVTHDQEEALTLGDRVVVLDRGAVQQADTPDALYERPANRFVAGFLGSPPMNLLDGRLVREADSLRFAGDGATLAFPAARRPDWLPYVGLPLVLGVRPEHLRLGPGPPGGGDAGGPALLVMEVRLVETLGPVRLVTLRRGGWAVTARAERPGPVADEGSPLAVAFDPDGAHLFDPASGLALCHGRPAGGARP
jgi:multiple sugar transport system ATP-binding protein